MSLPLATFDTKGMGSRATVPSINTDVKLSRGVKTAAPSAYPRDKLLGLADSPLAVSSVPDPERLRKFHSIVTSTPAPSPASAIQGYKGEGVPWARQNNMRRTWGARNMGMSAVTPTGTFGSFDSFSLIRPATEMQVMTPDEQEEAPINITFASLNLYGIGPGSNKQLASPQGILSPEAKEFVPSSTPVKMEAVEVEELMDYPASFSIKSVKKSIEQSTPRATVPSMKVRIDGDSEHQPDEDMPASSVESVAAKNGHSIPSRPTLCALPPNLPKWAHKDSGAKRPTLDRNRSSSSLMTTNAMASISESAAAVSPDRIMSPWRRRPSVGTTVDSIKGSQVPSQPQPIQTENLSPEAEKRPASAVRLGSAQGSRSWGIPTGSMASPARVPKMVTPTGLLGAVPMQAAGYK